MRWLPWCLPAMLLASCQSAVQRLAVPCALDAAAFHICRHEVASRFGSLIHSDEAEFCLQSDWAAVGEPTGERRATIFADRGELVVLVEARLLRRPWIGLPSWGEVELDALASRQLARALVMALQGG